MSTIIINKIISEKTRTVLVELVNLDIFDYCFVIILLFKQSLHLLESRTTWLARIVTKRRRFGLKLLKITIPECSLSQGISLLLRPVEVLQHRPFVHLKTINIYKRNEYVISFYFYLIFALI